VILAAAFCPLPPLLVPEVAAGAAGESDDLRSACREAVRRVAAPGAQLVVLGPGPVSAAYDARTRGTLAGFGVPLEISLGSDEPGPVELPLSLTVGAWLLRDVLGPECGAVGYSIGPDDVDRPELRGSAADPGVPVALLVMGDGSARRSIASPGYLDERAADFDAGVAAALRSGEADQLHVDAELGAELLAAGSRPWNAAADLLEGAGPYDAELLYDAAPYGVGYFVAVWTRRA
jgi:hypothetical protein